MTRRRKTDGERLARRMAEGWCDDGAHIRETANDIDRIIRRRMAEAWKEGWIRAWETPRVWTGDVPGNPYQGRKRKT